ncbi:molybdopterin-dependent oxidoreductase [Kibdelosporangium aridum]|uniref:molybdopterin-dependent oxidoreductase n=1 Tax=Kibdelosporangium aridum TaxID=2030 RepID=UPI0035EC65D0
MFGWQANNSADRLTTPLVREGDQLVESTWDEAMSRVVARSKQLLDEQGPSALGFYTSGQLFAEEYYTLAAIAHVGDLHQRRPYGAPVGESRRSTGAGKARFRHLHGLRPPDGLP